MAPLISQRILLLSTLSISLVSLIPRAYLQNHPLSTSKSGTIKTSNTLSAQAATSPSLKIINPRNHRAMEDSRSIFLSKAEIGSLTDEEILTRFTNGFFGGWILTPERWFIMGLKKCGMTMLPVGFSGLESSQSILSSQVKLSSKTLVPKQRIMDGNFMVLDLHFRVADSPSPEKETGSFVEIGFGDDRKTFSGMHHFEVSRQAEEEGGEEGVVLSYSSLACNPTVDKRIFSWVNGELMWSFHTFYALCLFRDGVREVLSEA